MQMTSEPARGDRAPVLSARNITKVYGQTRALDGVSLDLFPGEVHALLGENGAGKSTLLKVISGLEAPTSGAVVMGDRHFASLTPAMAIQQGIAIVPQHVQLAEDLDIADNLFLNRWPTRRGLVDRRRELESARQILASMGIGLDPRTAVADLTYVEKQMVEIARVSEFFAPRILILDEPTAALSVREVAVLFSMIALLRSKGVAIVYVSHFLSEIARIADRITIIRDGRAVVSAEAGSLSTDEVIRHMVGDVADLYPRPRSLPGEPVLELSSASFGSVRRISFSVRRGEVVGIAAPKGEGISDLFRALCGIAGRIEGEVRLKGVQWRPASSARAFGSGVGYLSEERSRWGLVTGKPILENLTIAALKKYANRAGLIDTRRERQDASELARRFLVRGAEIDAPIEALSGGNQQKMLLARLFNADLDLYVLDDPTFGVDVKSKAEINGLVAHVVDRGASVLLATSDLAELIQMSHRIIVIKGGALERELARDEVDVDGLAALLEGMEVAA